MEEEAEEVMDAREVLVFLAMNEMSGSADVIETLTALGMADVIAEAKILAEMEESEDQDPDDVPLDDPEPDDIADALGEEEDDS
jgi:hypothetical protein